MSSRGWLWRPRIGLARGLAHVSSTSPRNATPAGRFGGALVALALVSIGISAGLLSASPVRAAGFTGFVLDSEVGNGIGGGQLWDSDPAPLTATAVITGTQTNVTVTNGSWRFTFQSLGATFALQTYTFAPADIDVSHGNTGCANVDWAFQVLELPVIDGSGTVSAFAADFRLRCGLDTG